MTIPRNLSFLAEGASSTGVLGATYGGTGQSTITTGDLLYGSASNTISKLTIGSTGNVLRVVAGVPAWGTDYTGTVTSVAATVPSFLSITGSPITSSGTLAITYSGTALPVLNGGTGVTTSTGSVNNVLSTSPTLTTPIITTTLGVGAATPSASGAGISFPATQSASSDVNTLDDYEEGTWTPTDASGASLSFTYSGCKYTKIGRIVHLQGAITYPSTASTASAIWGGFPFNAADVITLSVIYTDAPTNTFNYLSGNTANVYLLTPGVNVTNVTMSGKQVIFSGTYTT